jgi:carbon storage regulator
MLVLSRRTDEKILIGPDVSVTVLKISSKRVKLGITCDREIPVLRKEMKIRQQKFPANAQGFPSTHAAPPIGVPDG